MASKKALLKNIEAFSPEEIAQAIRDGKVTMYELTTGTQGSFSPLLKYKVTQLLEQPAASATSAPTGTRTANDEPVTAPVKEPMEAPKAEPEVAPEVAPKAKPKVDPTMKGLIEPQTHNPVLSEVDSPTVPEVGISGSSSPHVHQHQGEHPGHEPEPFAAYTTPKGHNRSAFDVPTEKPEPAQTNQNQPPEIPIFEPGVPFATQQSSQYNEEVILDDIPVRNQTSKWEHYFSFNGRIGRREYTVSLLLSWCLEFAIQWAIFPLWKPEMLFVYAFLILPVSWFLLAQGAKRCHDLNCSGWYQLIPFYFIVLVISKGDDGDNAYGKRLK